MSIKKFPMPSRFFNTFLKFTFSVYLKIRFRIKFNNESVQNLKPPYLVIGNHVSFWDPFFLASGIKDPVSFVVSDSHFRIPILKFLLGLVGSIPKSKGIADTSTIRSIISIKNAKGVIGLYPEGRRSWEGKATPIFYSTAKLIKSLKIPVVSCIHKGVFLSKPRWGKYSRFGKVIMDYRVMLTPEEINKLDEKQIYKLLTNELNYNEYDWQNKMLIPFTGKNRAEYLELFLFICPNCKKIASLISKKHTLTCNNCKYSVVYDEFGFFVSKQHLYFRTLQEWSSWQDKYFKTLTEKDKYINEELPYFKDRNALFFSGFRRGKLAVKAEGTLLLYHKKLTFKSENNSIIFPLGKITGENVQNNNKFEFYFKNKLYRFMFKSPRVSVYKYHKAIGLIKQSIVF